MSTEMDSCKVYADTLAADLNKRAASIESLNKSLKTGLSVTLTPQAARNLASLIQGAVMIADRLEKLAEAETERANAAEKLALMALDLLKKSS